MLLELKQELKAGDAVPVTPVVEGAGGKRESIELKVPVKVLAESQQPKHRRGSIRRSGDAGGSIGLEDG